MQNSKKSLRQQNEEGLRLLSPIEGKGWQGLGFGVFRRPQLQFLIRLLEVSRLVASVEGLMKVSASAALVT
jgi:hypothetical protein